jgi:CRP/FNR family transcriptional regulator, cyclic AMP receptor protein
VDVPTFLEALTHDERELVRRRSRIRTLACKEIVFFEGELRAHPSVILDGFIRLERTALDGTRAVLGLRGPGDLIGEMPSLDGGRQPAEANALTGAEVLIVPTVVFEQVLTMNPTACASVAAGIAQQLRWSYEVCSDGINGVAKARVAGRILDVADVIGEVRNGAVEMSAPISQADLAGMAGVCRESATRVIGDLRRDGAIAYSGRRLRILRPDMLERIKCAGRGAGSSRSRHGAEPRRSRAPRDA